MTAGEGTTRAAVVGRKPRKNPTGLLRALRETAGVTPGDGARALGLTRDAMSRREGADLASIRIEDLLAHLRAFAPDASVRIDANRATVVSKDGFDVGASEAVDGATARVQPTESAESHRVGARLNSPVRAHEKGRP